MDDLAESSGLTGTDRAMRAQGSWNLYTSAHKGSQIEDLITDLLHLADVLTEEGGERVLASAELHYNAEVGDPEDD